MMTDTFHAFSVMAIFHIVGVWTCFNAGAVAEPVSDRLVRLPLFFDLTMADVHQIIETVTSFRGSQSNVVNDPLTITDSRCAA